jgi:mannose-1-phosphate guanylyltransferase/mannose-6-phosphate isomerase
VLIPVILAGGVGARLWPAGNRHRPSNGGREPLVIIEVQTGDYVEEDEIVRFDDVYGRS